MSTVLLSLPGNETLTGSLAVALDVANAKIFELGQIALRRFPDQESYVRIDSRLDGKSAILVSSLSRPDEKILPLIFVADTARELGASEVGLVAPYLAYMRQDRRFHPGEGVTSKYFARLLSSSFDWLVTVDPHLHRHSSLSELYDIRTQVVHAAAPLAEWIRANVAQPLIVGPDSESEQWVSAVAKAVGAPHIVLEKVRSGDREVAISVPQVEQWRNHTPVLVDDIVSTARTMIATVKHLSASNMPSPVCVAVHAVFADSAYEDLAAAGAARIVSCNTIVHPSNGIDLTSSLASAVRSILA
jgi:ribose-phosphate pyrophosphokinase